MTFARYYQERKAQALTSTIEFHTPANKGWKWAMVRAVYSDLKTHIKDTDIDFVGSTDLATLTVDLDAHPELVGSVYEIVFGTDKEKPTDSKFSKSQQAKQWDPTFRLVKTCMDEDPPPPPGLDGTFKVVSTQ